MKKTSSFLLFLMILCASIRCFSQENKLPLPFTPFYYGQDSLIMLFEKTFSSWGGKGGISGTQIMYTAEGASSSLRFSPSSIPQFFIEVTPGTEIIELVLVVKGDVKRKERIFIEMKNNMRGKQKDIGDTYFTPKLVSVGNNIYRIDFEQSLTAGEYAFLPIMQGAQKSSVIASSGKLRIYCFGVD